ncbi:sensor histidine kinase [Streptomyces sp. NPDC004284]|uniref:sensor histidine kinase n=1 Tax=Streptomyces sp. NPDC004284 TaxID=3364695 RepID=UPI00367E069A
MNRPLLPSHAPFERLYAWCPPFARDPLVALLLGGLFMLDADRAAEWFGVPLGLVLALICCFVVAFGARRFSPVPALVLAAVLLPVLSYTRLFLVMWLVIALVVYGVSLGLPPRRAAYALLAALASEVLVAAFLHWQAEQPTVAWGWASEVVVLQCAAWAAGWSAARGREYHEGLRLQAEQRAAAQLAEARRAVTEERLRIARELHDVVAHSMSIIAVQSGVGHHVSRDQPDEAAKALSAIERTSRSALRELRSLLGVLRDGDAAEFHPGGLADLDALIATSAQAGVEVEVSLEGEVAGLPRGVDRAAYRIVQEALTNVAKHARTDRAELAVSRLPGLLTLTIADAGVGGPPPGRTADPWESAGHGLIGMRERTALYGGDVTAGPLPAGGFRVVARLPLPADPHGDAPHPGAKHTNPMKHGERTPRTEQDAA